MSITADELNAAQKAWADGVIAIGEAHSKGDDYKTLAENFLEQTYLFNDPQHPLLFKPTRAAKIPFRNNLVGALSYFIGGNPDFAEDEGFALEPWSAIEFDNSQVFNYSDVAVTIGHYTLTDTNGKQATLEYSLGFIKDDNGNLKIFLHHSSIPYSAD